MDKPANNKDSFYKNLYNLSRAATKLDINKVRDSEKRYVNCVEAKSQGALRTLCLINCFSQLKLINYYMSDINIHKNLNAFQLRELEVYIGNISVIESTLKLIEPDVDVLKIISEG